MDEDWVQTMRLCFGIIAGLQWGLYIIMRLMHRTGYEVETIAFFLCSMGLAVIASAAPDEMLKMVLTLCMGLAVFVFLCFILQDLERAKKFRYIMAVGGVGLLAFNLIFGSVLYGAKNWVQIGPVSFQPSELVKICFVFVGASTMDRLLAKRNVILFIVYSGILCGCLALMNDFGTALVFFAGFVVIAFMRSGDFATIGLICTGTGFAGAMALRFKPYAMQRFEGWRHVWEYPNDSRGYQQTRAMMCIASGGLFGLGAGNGWLRYVAAADTDLVFALVSEEWGLLVAMMLVAAVALLGAFVVRSTATGRSSFYSIGACAAMAMLMVQTILNVFGTVDFLPLTGVTFPFVSNGGSSMISAWGLMAFVKAADTRQNASLAIKLTRRRKGASA
jgi:cell division protein FtsW (lipid II flippase)